MIQRNMTIQSTTKPVRNPSGTTILLCHFGGPGSELEVEPFLYALFMDPQIIQAKIPRWVRSLIARFIVRRRLGRIKKEYAHIGYSPINRYTQAQGAFLQDLLTKSNVDATVRVINRYTAPWAKDVISQIPNTNRIVVLTLYPHDSTTTVESSWQDIRGPLATRGIPPERITLVRSWWDSPAFLDLGWAYLKPVLDQALALPGPVNVLFSAHGIPQPYLDRGDPYGTHIRSHLAILQQRGSEYVAALKTHASTSVTWHLGFQSRVGPVQWAKPYTDVLIPELAKANPNGTLIMVPISFVSDHLETLQEIDVTYKELALASGFAHVLRVPGYNDDPRLAEVFVRILKDRGLI